MEFGRRKRWIKKLVYVVVVVVMTQQFWMTFSLRRRAHKTTKTCTDPKKRVFLMTIPRTGTATTSSMVWRYAILHNLTAILPKPGDNGPHLQISPDSHESMFPPYHTAVTELVYNPANLGKFLRVETTPYITTIRHPLYHLRSVLQNINGEEGRSVSLEEFLKQPEVYEKRWKTPISLSNNPFGRFFGLHPNQFHNRTVVSDMIKNTDRDFTAVLILEKMDESLVMLRRAMCWSFKDILYNLDYKLTFPEIAKPGDIVHRHRARAVADYAIYDHFSNKLENFILKGGKALAQEVIRFKSDLQKVNDFCNRVLNKYDSLEIGGSDWGGLSTITANDCMYLLVSAKSLRNILRERQGLTLEKEY